MKLIQKLLFSVLLISVSIISSCSDTEAEKIEEALGIESEDAAAEEEWKKKARERSKESLKEIESRPPATSSFDTKFE